MKQLYRILLSVLALTVYTAAEGQLLKKSSIHFTGKSSPVTPPNPDASLPNERNCYTVESERKLSERLPGRQSAQSFENLMGTLLKNRRSRRTAGDEIVYRIPTIVHIVHHGEPVGTGSNISREQVMSQFDVLNEDFRRLGQGYNEHADGADIRVEFVPVLFDPEGNRMEEPGIDRVFGYNAYYEYDPIELELKPNTQWDPDRYFNIWVLKFGGGYANFLGYAQFPSFSGLEGLPEDGAAYTDGVVIGYQYFGRTGNVSAPFDGGRTTTHEVGHWLGLRHIWGDGDCSMDDFCADTPNADGPNTSCTFRDSCPGEGADMIENYMDYSTDACMNVFTNDQKQRIRTVLEVSPRRRSLVACQQAPAAITGLNVAEAAYSWFEYTSTEDEVISISSVHTTSVDTKLSIFRDCNTIPIDESDNANGTAQSQLSISMQSGETIKIFWQARDFIEPFEWTLVSSPPVAGAACGVAEAALEGTVSMAVTELPTYWYRYTAEADNRKVHILPEGKSVFVYKGSCEGLSPAGSGTAPFTIYDVDAGESIFIAFESGGGDFTWSFVVDESREAETCASAKLANEGLNVIDYSSPFQYWYQWAAPTDGTVTLQAVDEHQSDIALTIIRTCDGLPATTRSTQPASTISVAAGETIRFAWDAPNGIQNFTWTLTSTPFDNGEICSRAKVVNKGISHTDAAPQWFQYTVKSLSNLRISSLGLTEANTHLIVKRECDGQILEANDDAYLNDMYTAQSEVILYGVTPGETFYILWSEKWSYEGFDWEIEEVRPLSGDNCPTAKHAVEGVNTVDYRPHHKNFGGIFWMKFTVPAAGKKVTVLADKPVDMAMYLDNDCETFSFVDGSQGKASAFNLPEGTELLIIWDDLGYDEDFTFDLAVDNIIPGDICQIPVRAKQGNNGSPYTPFWYDYEMSQTGSVKIRYEGGDPSVIPFVAVVDGCADDANLFFSGREAFISGLEEGQHLLIYWNIGYPYAGVTWSLEEVAAKQGDSCADPLPASYGINHSEYATQWYAYTAETGGTVKISSRPFTFSNTDLYVYDGCNGNLLGHSDDVFSFEDFIQYFQSELTIGNVEAGQTLLIKWAGTHSFEPFDWSITDGLPQRGDSCEDPLTAVEGVNNAMMATPVWFTFTMPETGPLTLSSLGYSETNTYVEVYDGCNGNLIGSNDDYLDAQSFLYIPELAEGQTVLIRWANFYTSEQYTFDWRLYVGGPDPGTTCEFPAQAQIGTNITPAYTSNYFWHTFTIPEDNKKLVITRITPSASFYRTIGVTTACDRMFDYGLGEDKVVISDLSAGETVYIFWGELTAPGERAVSEWTLELVDAGAGDVCASALGAQPGISRASGVPTWYHYTMPFDGNVKLSSVGLNSWSVNTYVEVYDGCNGNLIASNDDPDDYSHFLSEVYLQGLPEGTELLVMWRTMLPFQIAFDWKLSLENPSNHPPALQDAMVPMTMAVTNGSVVATLQGQDEDGDPLTYGIISGNDDGAFALNATSGALTVSDRTKISPRTLEVSASDGFAEVTATITIDIVTGVMDAGKMFVRAFPNPAKDNLRIDVADGVIVKRITLVDTRGIVKAEASGSEVALSNVGAGIYVVRIDTNRGRFTSKVVILK